MKYLSIKNDSLMIKFGKKAKLYDTLSIYIQNYGQTWLVRCGIWTNGHSLSSHNMLFDQYSEYICVERCVV